MQTNFKTFIIIDTQKSIGSRAYLVGVSCVKNFDTEKRVNGIPITKPSCHVGSLTQNDIWVVTFSDKITVATCWPQLYHCLVNWYGR